MEHDLEGLVLESDEAHDFGFGAGSIDLLHEIILHLLWEMVEARQSREVGDIKRLFLDELDLQSVLLEELHWLVDDFVLSNFLYFILDFPW